MKPKQSKSNKSNNNNNKRNKQQQQQQQQQHDARQQQQPSSVTSELMTTPNDDVKEPAAETADTMTSSIAECPEERHVTADICSDNQSSTHHLPADSSATGHVINRCPDDVTSDVEVADILHSAPVVTPNPGVSEVTTSDPGQQSDVITEVIMSKTFTESTHPDREFVPIRRDTGDDDVIVGPLPVEELSSRLTVRCELVSQPPPPADTTSSPRAMTSSVESDSVYAARGQLRDLTSQFRHLQLLLDDMTSPAAALANSEETTSSEDEQGEELTQSRVVYHYHLHEERPPASRRWIRRTGAGGGDSGSEGQLNTEDQRADVVEDPQDIKAGDDGKVDSSREENSSGVEPGADAAASLDTSTL